MVRLRLRSSAKELVEPAPATGCVVPGEGRSLTRADLGYRHHAPVGDNEGDRLWQGEHIYVRARLESARIEEGYSYHQEISQNSASRMLDEPTGLIKLVLPYDGDMYFTRQAQSDVVRAHQLGADPREHALAGHLAFTNYEHTDLD